MIRLSVNNKNITDLVVDRLIELTLTDERAESVDTLSIVLDNNDGAIELPEPGALLTLWLPTKRQSTTGNDWVNMGKYNVDSVEISGPPSILSINARSGDITETLKLRREQSWEKKTVGEIIRTIAARNKLTPTISNTLEKIKIDHIDQTSESDLSFVARLGELYSAVSTIKDGRLLFVPLGDAKKIDGEELKPVNIALTDCSSWRLNKQKTAYTGVKAYWNKKSHAKRHEVQVGEDENPFIIRGSYRTAALALTAAKARWSQLQRAQIEMSIELSYMDPNLIPEQPIKLSGFLPELSELNLIIERVSHKITDSSGRLTSLEIEKKL